MPLSETVRKSEFLGREFLLWLWFKSETHEGRFDLGETGQVELWIDHRVVLQTAREDGVEKVVCSGENPHLREARFALKQGKEVTEAMVSLTIGDHAWSFILDSTWMNFKSFRTPRVIQDKGGDPEGLFYEKIYLVEQAIDVMDAIYSQFVKIRLSPGWKTRELPSLLEWIRGGI